MAAWDFDREQGAWVRWCGLHVSTCAAAKPEYAEELLKLHLLGAPKVEVVERYGQRWLEDQRAKASGRGSRQGC